MILFFCIYFDFHFGFNHSRGMLGKCRFFFFRKKLKLKFLRFRLIYQGNFVYFFDLANNIYHVNIMYHCWKMEYFSCFNLNNGN